MNLSRAYSLAYGEGSLGRPRADADARHGGRARTRHPQLRARGLPGSGRHVPSHGARGRQSTYQGTWFRERPQAPTRNRCSKPCACPPTAKRRTGSSSARAPAQAAIESIEAQTQRMAPPPLYDLTELQRHANRLFGFSAQKTLDIAQALYERHKLISYPRTDSRHLSQDVAATLPRIVERDRRALSRAPRARHGRAAAGPAVRRRRQGHRPPRHHPHRHRRPTRPRSRPEEAQDLRPDLPPPAERLARRPHLVGHHRDHGDHERRTSSTAITRPGSAVQQVGWKVLDLAPAQRRRKARPRTTRRGRSRSLPPGLAKRTAAGRGGRRGR